MKIASILLILVCSVCAHAQKSKSKLEELITNGNRRQWMFADYKKTLGPECTGNGILFTFMKNGKVQVKSCENGQLSFKELNWALIPLDNQDMEWKILFTGGILVIEGHDIAMLRVDLPSAKPKVKGKKMIWRQFPGCKSCPGADITLVSKN